MGVVAHLATLKAQNSESEPDKQAETAQGRSTLGGLISWREYQQALPHNGCRELL